MSDGKEMVRQRFKELDNGNFDVLDELFSPDYELHPGGGAPPVDLEGTKRLYRALYDAIPDLKHEIDDQLEDGDKVVTRWTATGKQRQGLLGASARDGEVTFSGINIYTIDGGKFVRSDVSWDLLPVALPERESLFDGARGTGKNSGP
jgi:ketosteroid isomerase-like protein